jgi:hypothetical protein
MARAAFLSREPDVERLAVVGAWFMPRSKLSDLTADSTGLV